MRHFNSNTMVQKLARKSPGISA